jgi:DNA invertase Pin-like site-specific DNA recombinase
MKTATATLRARAYIRVSHVGKGRQDTLLSDAMQLDEARRYCQFAGIHLDEEASKQYADLDVSGFKKKWRERPGLKEHYEAAKRGEFDILVFFKISRLARNVREALDMIDCFERLGVAFHFVAERIDSTSAQGRFLRNVLLASAEMQSEDASAFLKSACERRAREGRLQGGAVPAWIRRTDSGGYELIPEMAETIRRLVELRLQGLGYNRIARQLNLEGRTTVQGKDFTQGNTQRYLSPDWIATMRGTGFFRRGTAEPIELPDIFPPLLDEDTANRLLAVQKLYCEDYGTKPVGGLDWAVSKRRKRGRYSASSIHLLSSIIFCPHCGKRMVAASRTEAESGHRATPFRYVCPRYRTNTAVHPQGMGSVAANMVEDAVLRVIRQALVLPPAPAPARAEQKPDERGIEALQGKIDRLLTMHLDGKINTDDFTRMYDELLAKKARLQEQTSSDRPELHRQALTLATREDLSREELRQLVLLMVERVESPLVFEGQTVREESTGLRRFARVTLRFPRADGHQTFLAPLHRECFVGERRVYLETEITG